MPGTLYPPDEPRATKSAAERKLWQRLKTQLPGGWRAWHSLKLRQGSRWQGESDFVIAAPDRGLLVLEVKGGQLELRGGHWYQNGEKLKDSPKSQADGFVRKLAGALRDRGAAHPPYGTACAFPDCDFSGGPTCGDLEGLVIGERQLPYLGEALPALFERAVPPYDLPKDGKWLATLHELWGETWVPEVKLHDRASDAEARRIQLDEEQLQILDFAGETPRAHVKGGAGSGKTVVARELCIRRAAAGQRVQYFCFTEALGHAVARHLRDGDAGEYGKNRIRAAPIRRYAAELLKKAGRPTIAVPA